MSVLVIGEALLDIFDGLRRPGGSPMNVAVGLARLGVTTVLHTTLGNDDAGQLIAEHLRASGVHITPESWTPRPTSVAEVQLDSAGNATYHFDITWDPAPIATSSDPDAVHIGSITSVMQPGSSVVDAILDATHASAMLSYDLNIRPAIMGDRDAVRERAEGLVARIDIVKASEDDIAWLYPSLPVDRVLEHWLDLGAGMAILTCGGQGARAINARTSVAVAAPPANIRDTIGAGDSFMSGLLAALDDLGILDGAGRACLPTLSARHLREILDFAVRCATVTVTRDSADPPCEQTSPDPAGVGRLRSRLLVYHRDVTASDPGSEEASQLDRLFPSYLFRQPDRHTTGGLRQSLRNLSDVRVVDQFTPLVPTGPVQMNHEAGGSHHVTIATHLPGDGGLLWKKVQERSMTGRTSSSST